MYTFKRPRKAAAGQKEMLLPISGKRTAKQEAKKAESPQRHEVGSGHDRSGISVAVLRQAGFIIANYLEPEPHTH